MNNKIVLVIMDGIGYSKNTYGNAVLNAKTPNLDYLTKNYPHTLINASGKYVGLPNDDDMGNSEVGHNALGCGQIYSQGAKLVNEAIESKKIFESNTWKKLVDFCKENTMHFIGLLSDGNVHSNISHLFALLEQAKKFKVKKVRIHILLDGRDVYEKSALKYVEMLEKKLTELNDDNFDAKIASGGGRMVITMDRYEADWQMVEKGWHTHVLGDATKFKDSLTAIQSSYNKGLNDQYIEPFVIVNENKPVGQINDNDSVVFFNFRGDRALEISKCFDDENFSSFDLIRKPNVLYAGMLQYDVDFKIPNLFLTEPPVIENTLTEELLKYNIRQYAISETQKYGHVTYFWNGNRLEKFDSSEEYKLIESDNLPFDLQPKMKSYEITDELIKAINSNNYDFMRINFPNGDMIGHTGNYEKTIEGVEAVDENIGRIMQAVNENQAILIILADHGNAEEMYQLNNKDLIPKTSHTTNQVPFIIYGPDDLVNKIKIKNGEFGLANIASTIATLFDIKPNNNWLESIIEIKK